MMKTTKNSITKIKLATVVATGLTLAACGNAQQTRGYIFDPELASAIQAGVDNKQSVQATMGTPTIQGSFNDDVWYYVATRVKLRPIFLPKTKHHRVMAIRFSDTGTVQQVDNYDMSNMRQVAMAPGKTPTLGKQMNLFQQLFMNVGRFSGSAPVGGPGGPGPNGS